MRFSQSRRFVEDFSSRTAAWASAHRTLASLSAALGITAATASALSSSNVRLDGIHERPHLHSWIPFARECVDAVSSTWEVKRQDWKHSGMTPSTLERSKCEYLDSIESYYKLEGVIGQGGFGSVHAARHRRTGEVVAIKVMKKEAVSMGKFLQEVAILKLMGGQHNIIQLWEAFETTDSYVMVTELVEGGDLFEHLLDYGIFAEQSAKQLIKEISQALSFLHNKRVVHADIKPENILLAENEDGESVVRLIDFGLAYRQQSVIERRRSASGSLGTLAYSAPEYLARQESNTCVDMWALGVVLYIILCGYHPFDPDNDATDEQLKQRILAGKFERDSSAWKCISTNARDLICGLLCVDSMERLTAAHVLEHEWIRSRTSA